MPDAALEVFLHEPVMYGLVFALGTLLGSFANVCILRIPARLSIVWPGSRCGTCGTPIRWYDNIPILSWLVLRGRCRACGARFSARYLLVEALVGALALATYVLAIDSLWFWDPVPTKLARFAAYLLLEEVLVILAVIDIDHRIIPDRITYPAIPVFVLFGLGLRDQPWWGGLLGVAVGYGIVRLISDGYYYLTGREGLGYGDGKLLAIVGGLLGWQAVAFALFGGALLGSVIAGTGEVVRRSRRRRTVLAPRPSAPEAPGETGQEGPAAGAPEASEATTAEPSEAPAKELPLGHVEVPFGPFLAAAAVAYVFLQEQVVTTFAGLWAPVP